MIQIEYSQTEYPHPCKVTEKEWETLFSAFSDMLKPNKRFSKHKDIHSRKDASVLIISLSFIAGGLATSILQEAGKDIYTWAKNHLLKLMKTKIEESRNTSSSYVAKPPIWKLTLSSDEFGVVGFKGEIEVTSEKHIIEALDSLNKYLETQPLNDLDKIHHYWSARETLRGIHYSYGPEES